MDDIRPPPDIVQGGQMFDGHLVFACLVCFCCNLPLGLIALYLASQYTNFTIAVPILLCISSRLLFCSHCRVQATAQSINQVYYFSSTLQARFHNFNSSIQI